MEKLDRAQKIPRSYAGLSQAERVGQRRTLLIETAMKLSEELGWQNVTVERLCQSANLNKRYFYESFADLELLSSAIIDHVMEELIVTMMPVIQNKQSISEMAHLTIHTFVHFMIDRPSRAKLIFGDLIYSESMVNYRKIIIKKIVYEIIQHAREIHQVHSIYDPIIETSATFLLGGTGQVIMNWLDSERKISLDKLIADLTALWLITGNGAAEYVQHMHKADR